MKKKKEKKLKLSYLSRSKIYNATMKKGEVQQKYLLYNYIGKRMIIIYKLYYYFITMTCHIDKQPFSFILKKY